MKSHRKRVLSLATSVLAIAISTAAAAQSTLNAEIAPSGKLRVGMHAANANLVTRAADGSVSGLAVDLGKFIAGKIGVPFEPVVYPSNARFIESFGKGEWDTTVAGRNPFAERMLDYMPNVMLVEYVFVAAPGREFADAGQVDRTGIRIGVAGSATGDVFLSRTLKSAALVRVAGDVAIAIDLLRSGEADLFATSNEVALIIADRLAGAKVIPGVFTTVEFAVAMPKGRSPAVQDRITQLVKQAKSADIVKRAIENAGLRGVRVAPD